MLNDQAAGLRALHSQQNSQPKQTEGSKVMPKSTSNQKPVRVIAVASGKGGVGKTNVSVNLGIQLSKMGNRVLLMDADMGLANVDIMLGLHTQYNLSHVLDGQKTLREVIIEGPGGLKIIPAASGVKRMAQLNAMENAGIINAFSELADDLDVLLIDTAAGIADSVVSFCRAAQEVIVVVTDEPASITDAYALIKVLSRDYQVSRFRLLANMAKSPAHGRQLFEKLSKVTEQFLDVSIDYFGAVPYDQSLKDAVQKQIPVSLYRPSSLAANAFENMANNVQRWPTPKGVSGYLQFFVENLFQGN
ncbi:MinD/ParA family protein [Thiomicrorhabdus sp. 6S2-11]|jgi:flagellar biosynthesis protein FlhG|uniref:MinD/ParA family protein n=1 Tax=Thiomicrorhabdus marina TaxID=2818442 RepID=A0ABS3Q7P5_9GAMM|nr:MinD/ParA family protein [Thiomicrorhabdus marina]MBO1928336.1 MinD/ParA family protein [Thiomicrorhabdus marina]